MEIIQQMSKTSLTLLQQQNSQEERFRMKKLYTSPKVEIVEFDAKDIITTSGDLDQFFEQVANEYAGWTELY